MSDEKQGPRFAAPMFESADGLHSSGIRLASTGPGVHFRFHEPPKSFRFVDENGAREVLVLHRDGRVEIGAHLTPDAAGQKVFEVLRALWAQHMGAPPPSTSQEKAVPPKTWTLEEIRAAWLRAQETGRPEGARRRSEDDLENGWGHVLDALTGK